jgi:hypothetical protein
MARSVMRRIQFIELHEQPWFPKFLRDDITDTLQFALSNTAAYGSIAPLFQRALHDAKRHSIVDLCSGAGGPWLDLGRRLESGIVGFNVLMTDKFPNVAAFETAQTLSGVPMSFYPQSVDAREVPQKLDGFRTIFSAFHHFRPEDARAVIQNTVDAKQGIGIFEITRRTTPAVASMILWALSPLFFTPFVRPFRWSRLFFTYLVPLIPFVLLFDGIVSCLRTYRPSELSDLVHELRATDYEWQAGEFRESILKAPITYLIGFPCASAAD